MRAPGKREQNKLENRTAILQAAQGCFLDLGYDGVTIRDVIRRTGLASGTFYNYFPDKESLFRALLESRIGVLNRGLHEAREGARSLEDFLYSAYLTTFREMRSDPGFYAMLFRNEPVVRAFYSDSVMGLIMGALRDDVADAFARGMLPATDADALAAVLFGAGYEMSRLLVQEPQRDAESAARFCSDVFLHGLSAGAQPSDAAALIRRGPFKLKGAAR